MTSKISAKFRRSHPQRGRQIEVGGFKSAIFDEYLGMSQNGARLGHSYYYGTLI